jgi:ABC-type transporter Mla MlaB component
LAETHRIVVPETVRFDNYALLCQAACRDVDSAPEGAPLEISFEDRSSSGSIGVALMIAVFRHAHTRGRTIRFVEIPVDLRNIIEVADLEDVLPLEAASEPSAALKQD